MKNGMGCQYTVSASLGVNYSDIYIWAERCGGAAEWDRYCEYDAESAIAATVCKQLFAQGWKQGDYYL